MLKIGVIGAGHLGKIHIKLIKEIASYKLIGFHDADRVTALKVADDYGVVYYPNLEQLIDECDVIDIVTPTITHFDLATKALKKSKHILLKSLLPIQ